MIRRRLLLSLLFSVGGVLLGAILTVATGTTPSLGIDLSGGVSITQILDGEYPREAIEQARDLMEENASGLGVTEPEVVIQGDTIVANLPNVDDVDEAIRLLQVTGALSLRPALASCTVPDPPPADATTTTTTTPPTSSTLPAPPDLVSANPTTTTTIDPSAPTTLPPVSPIEPGLFETLNGGTCYLGPEGGTGEVFDKQSANAGIIDGGWGVTVELRGGDGENTWNALAAQCASGSSTCPTRQLAIVLDDKVISAPRVNEANFTGGVQITGSFTEQEARDLASTLDRGALPVRFKDEPNVDRISASLGKDSLRAAWVAGLIGVLLVLLFVAVYYRGLGLLAAAGLLVSAGVLWIVLSLAGAALTLPGIAGIIVSVGVTIDSYVVFFERLKEEVHSGRSIRNSTPRAFAGAWRTIVVADIVSFLGALTLYVLSAGNVRNFALFLGISTLADLFVAFFFTRPAATLLSRTRWAEGRKVMGIEATTGATGVSVDKLHSDRRGVFGRLYHGETAIDFYGRRWWGLTISVLLIVVAILSLSTRQLNLGIDFEGGVAWEVPSETLTEEQATAILEANSISTENSKVQERTVVSTGQRVLKVQVGTQPESLVQKVQAELAEAGAVDADEINRTSVSASWGETVTRKAIRALIVFLILVALFIAWRMEWRMALASIIAVIHDVLISVGVYSLFGFVVTPATVVAFLTILGFSLYDSIVVFDKVRENTVRFSTSRVPYADVINVSMNQVLMRSLNTSLAAVLPVVSLLVLGSGVFGAVTLRDFALALLVGLVTGSYSSIFVATPLVAMFKSRESKYAAMRGQHVTGAELERLVQGGMPAGRREARRSASTAGTDAEQGGTVLVAAPVLSAEDLLSHAPRPRRKKRRDS
jgi:protein-export membrane protein SecD/preprotein translocase SecF subunit